MNEKKHAKLTQIQRQLNGNVSKDWLRDNRARAQRITPKTQTNHFCHIYNIDFTHATTYYLCYVWKQPFPNGFSANAQALHTKCSGLCDTHTHFQPILTAVRIIVFRRSEMFVNKIKFAEFCCYYQCVFGTLPFTCSTGFFFCLCCALAPNSQFFLCCLQFFFLSFLLVLRGSPLRHLLGNGLTHASTTVAFKQFIREALVEPLAYEWQYAATICTRPHIICGHAENLRHIKQNSFLAAYFSLVPSIQLRIFLHQFSSNFSIHFSIQLNCTCIYYLGLFPCLLSLLHSKTAHIYLPSWRTWKHNKRTQKSALYNFRSVFIGSAVKCVGFIVLLACMVIMVDCVPANECIHNEQEKWS